jgi:HlyD family secretion protein
MDYQSAEEELKAALEKGNSRKSARYQPFELDNAEARMKQAERDIAAPTITAPVSGIIMKPPAGGQAKEGKTCERGTTFQQGEAAAGHRRPVRLFNECKVDEVDVTKVKLGQQVRVTGDAFPGEQLTGSIQSISPHAEEGEAGKGAPSFGIRVVIDSTPELKKNFGGDDRQP